MEIVLYHDAAPNEVPRPCEREANALSRRPYRTPTLDLLGDVRDITLGGSPGNGDSGSTGGYEAPFGAPSRNSLWDADRQPDKSDAGANPD